MAGVGTADPPELPPEMQAVPLRVLEVRLAAARRHFAAA
jgi:hypothetical protein